MPHFTIAPVEQDELLRAWPLVRAAHVHVDADRWLGFAKTLLGRGGAVLAASGADGTFHGVATWEPGENLHLGRTLHVAVLVTFELSKSAPARAALCEALEDIARDQGCDAVTVAVPTRGFIHELSKRIHRWESLGLDLEDLVLQKSVAGSASPAAKAV